MSSNIRRISAIQIVSSDYQNTVSIMASKTLLFLLGLTIIAVAYGAWVEETQVADGEDLTVEEVFEYFNAKEIEKRPGKIGPCKQPNGKPCKFCNLRIKNEASRRRYVQC